MNETQIERAISKSKTLFSLLMVEENASDGAKPIHPITQSLLREFEDVVRNDLPLGLPFLRGIKH